jgi:ABC-type nitrate/sulfonate/bicarbonate transport system substrate-binding protein
LPDALPLMLGVFRPIFKENMLEVEVTSYSHEEEGIRLFSEESLEGLICDLPTALVLTRDVRTKARIVKNVLRTNPYRSLFALVGGSNIQPENIRALEGPIIAVPRGLSFRFYAEYFLKMLDIPLTHVTLQEAVNQAEAWSLLEKGEVVAAVLRTPYTEIAKERKRSNLADDRTTPWMSVMVFRQEVIQQKRKVLEKFIFGLEQSVLALNLKPNEFRSLLREKGCIPPGIERKFPMPIFEGANCPSPEELEVILAWLDHKGLLPKDTPYEELIDTSFLPDPNDVGLAFCCR